MEYETSYDTGLKPFNHDKNRGKWASSKDFFFACAGHAFKGDASFVIPMVIFSEFGIFAVIPYLIILAVCVVPIVFIQSFLGQFSSTGYISAFRIVPLFKGLGYVSLVVNFATLTYYSLFSAIPLFYFFHTLRPTIPWSCQGAEQWMNSSQLAVSICSKDQNIEVPLFERFQIPSVQFFTNRLDVETRNHRVEEIFFSGQLMLCSCIVWGLAAFIVLKPTEFIGKFLRYSFLAVIAIMCTCLIRFIFLPGVIDGVWGFFQPPKQNRFQDTWFFLPSMVLSTFGPGWGSILTMASYNNFKTDIFRYSWVMCLGQFGVMAGMAFLAIFIKHFMNTFKQTDRLFLEFSNEHWLEFLRIPTGLTFLEWPHVWSLLFFAMWILGSLSVLVVQILSLLTSLFDEFEDLRKIKRKIIFGAIGVFSMTSILFSSNLGLYFLGVLTRYSIITQTVLNLLLLLVVLWIYGRERFQRDVNFMTSRIYPTWMVYVVRFVAPIFLFFGLLIGLLLFVEFDHSPKSGGMILYLSGILIFLLPWCLIPGYCILKVKQTTGIISMRLRRCLRPTDWYPADPLNKQRYEESFNSMEISHQLATETLE